MPKNILVIDDEEPIRTMVGEVLEAEGYRVVLASNAAEAEYLIQGEDFSLIVLDLVLPDTTAFELLVQLKQSRPAIPVLILTGIGYEEDILQDALEAGADGFVSKLDTVENLISEVHRLLIGHAPPGD